MSRAEPKLSVSNHRQKGAGKKGNREVSKQAAGKATAPATSLVDQPSFSLKTSVGLTTLFVLAGVVSYWPTLMQLVRTWDREPDYSHGFLVVPLAVWFLWLRRASFPGLGRSSPLLAVFLLSMSLGLRFLGDRFFFTFMDGWSIVPWAAAVAAALGGWPLLRWSLPSIGFLIFMVPLPFRFEGELSAPLQRIATKISTTALQILGQSAFNEGNVILLGEEKLEVAQACSGLRLFMSVLALTYAFITVIARPWWEKLMLALAAIPIAIVSNSARIVVTGLIYEYTKSESIRRMAHDSAGWGMILFAAAVFGLLLWYLKHLIVEEETVEIDSIVRRAAV